MGEWKGNWYLSIRNINTTHKHILSATGSIILPKSVTRLALRAKKPSKISDKTIYKTVICEYSK